MAHRKLFCSVCVKQHQKSTMRCLGLSTTAMGFSAYYDEDGNFHSHDPNWRKELLECSRGHLLECKYLAECPSCDYDGGRECMNLVSEKTNG